MKTLLRIAIAATILAVMTGCDAFRILTESKRKTAQGRPYELVVVCPQREWAGEVGDSLRAILAAPIPFLNQTEPLFDILRVQPQGFSGIIADHRNILKVLEDPSIAQTSVAVQYDITAEPQIVLTLQGPNDKSLVAYLSEHREKLVQVLESAERDRAKKNATAYDNPLIQRAIKSTFGVEIVVPKGYTLAAEQADFLWARYEYPAASQGFFIYSYPYEGKNSLSEEALIATRNLFAARIPGPSDGSFMTTSDAFEPSYRIFRLEGRLWCELRGFWDVKGDFMGGPFVSYSTLDTATNRVITLDGYIFSPKHHKRNLLRGVEDLLYMIKFPEAAK